MLKNAMLCSFLLLASIGPLNAHAAAYETARMSKWEEKAVEEAKRGIRKQKCVSRKSMGSKAGG